MNRTRSLAALTLTFGLLAPLAHAEAPTEETEQIVVEGRRLRPLLAALVSDAATVIPRSEIEGSQARTLADVLREQPGVTVRSAGGPGKQTSVSLRGSEADQVQVLVDGVRVGSATSGDFNWANLAAGDVERVEILRGAQSTLFGANAMGGVIQVFTRDGRSEPRVSLRGGVGNEGQDEIAATASGTGVADIRYFLSAQRTTIDGVSAFDPDSSPSPRPDDDPFRNITLSGRLSAPVGPVTTALSVRYAESETDLDNSRSDNPDFEQKTDRMQLAWDARYPVTQAWITGLRLAQSEERLRGDDPNVASNEFDIRSVSRQASWLNEVSLGPASLVGGVDFESERGRNFDSGISESMRQTGAFLQASAEWGPIHGNAGVRYEWNSISEDRATYQLGLRLELTPWLDLLANYGTAFRPPTLNELFFENAFAEGNPDLDPEKTRSVDVGLRLRHRWAFGLSLRAEAWGFHQRYRNLIEFRFGPDFVLRPVNVEKARVWGLETSLRAEWKGLWLRAAWTHLDSEDEEKLRLRRRPDNAGRVALGGRHGPASLEVLLRAVGASFSRSGERDRVDRYALLDVNAAYEFRESVVLRAHVHNLADRDYEEIFDRGTLGRTYFASLELRL
ncbi:MAG: TonB-dependent receptor [Proteobacteria bacterium]|nr:TonB-dependent receptor [Pseudomonadota bacterium]